MPEANKKCFHKVSHIIFDNDGTLMDSENIYSLAVEYVLKKYDKEFNYDLKLRIMGRPSSSMAEYVINYLDLPITAEEFVNQYETEANRMMGNVPLLPGVDNLLRHFHDQRIPMAIATSSTRNGFCIKARRHRDLLSTIHHVVCGDDRELRHGKPAADIFLLAASRFNPQPEPHCCLVFEDSPLGVQAAVAAGMQVVMIPDPRVPKEQTEEATLVLRSLEEFQPELFGLPYIDYGSKFTFG